MEISFWSHFKSNKVTATKFCTCHDSCAVVACTKICSNNFDRIVVKAKWKCHQIWISSKNLLAKWTPRHIHNAGGQCVNADSWHPTLWVWYKLYLLFAVVCWWGDLMWIIYNRWKVVSEYLMQGSPLKLIFVTERSGMERLYTVVLNNITWLYAISDIDKFCMTIPLNDFETVQIVIEMYQLSWWAK